MCVAFILIGRTQIEKQTPKNGQQQQQQKPLLKKEKNLQPVLHSNLITTRTWWFPRSRSTNEYIEALI